MDTNYTFNTWGFHTNGPLMVLPPNTDIGVEKKRVVGKRHFLTKRSIWGYTIFFTYTLEVSHHSTKMGGSFWIMTKPYMKHGAY